MSSRSDTSNVSRDKEMGHDVPTLASEVPLQDALARRTCRKLDLVILPVLTMFYLLSFLDRSNIGNARVAGLQKDLKMTDRQYSICITITYVPYILAELPANLLLRKIGPRYLMSTLLTVWGILVMCEGFVKSFAGLSTLRAFLGLVEGPMFPGIILTLSMFYTRAQLSARIAVIISMASFSGAFSGLLASAIQNMHGIGGKAGWSWIFILEGLFSFLFGIFGYFVVPSSLDHARFLDDNEKRALVTRLERDRPALRPGDHFSIQEVFRSLKSPHVLLVFIILYLQGTTLYGLAFFLPTIVGGLGFSPNHTQLLSVGPFAVGFVVTMITALWSDHTRNRALPTVAVSCLAIAGFCVYLTADNKFVSYGSLFLTVPGIYATPAITSAWQANNSEPHYRRATSIALGFIATNSGGITSTWLFPSNEGPKYRKATILSLVFTIVVIFTSIANVLLLVRKNKQKKQNREMLLAPYLYDEDGGTKAWQELGDAHPDFVYCL